MGAFRVWHCKFLGVTVYSSIVCYFWVKHCLFTRLSHEDVKYSKSAQKVLQKYSRSTPKVPKVLQTCQKSTPKVPEKYSKSARKVLQKYPKSTPSLERNLWHCSIWSKKKNFQISCFYDKFTKYKILKAYFFIWFIHFLNWWVTCSILISAYSPLSILFDEF